MKLSPGEKKVVTIWLQPEKEVGDRERIKMFHCFNCRIPLVQYQGEVVTIVPGDTPYEPKTIIKCKGTVSSPAGGLGVCGQYYIFIGSSYTKTPEYLWK